MSKVEIEACRQSKHYFFENYYMIPVIGSGATLFVLRDYQEEILDAIEKYDMNIALKARQIGWTTIAVGNTVHDALFNEAHPWLLVSRNEDAAMKMLDKAKYAYFRLPEWMKRGLPKLTSYTQTSMEFDNGSYIEAVPATGSTGRGDSVYGALMDEGAFMEYAEEIYGAVEPLVDKKIMIFSTANGMGNFFHEIWLDSQRADSAWNGLFYPWDVVPSRAANPDWYEDTKLRYRGREWLFYQEYPSSPEEAFAKSGRVAFASDLLAEAYVEMEPVEKWAWDLGNHKAVRTEFDADILINVWVPPEVVRNPENEKPRWKPNYVVGCDVAEGLDHGDYSYINVFDINTHEQVASCKSSIPVSYLDEVLDWIGHYYFRGLMVVERNAVGILPLDRLYRDRWYPRMYRADRFAEIMLADRTPAFGWRTDKATKPKMVNDFIYALAEGNVILHDPEFLLEAQTFVADGKGGFGATSNNHDDVIMGTLIAWQGLLDSYQYEILWEDTTVTAPTHDDLDSLFFPVEEHTSAALLEKPLGQKQVAKPKRSILFTPANFGPSEKN